MAEDKANALNQANSIKLIMGPMDNEGPKVIDITDAVRSAYDSVPEEDSEDNIIGEKQLWAYEFQKALVGFDILGDAYPAIGVCSGLDKLEEDIKPIIEASIVNAAQKEAILRIIHSVFDKYITDKRNSAEYAANVL